MVGPYARKNAALDRQVAVPGVKGQLAPVQILLGRDFLDDGLRPLFSEGARKVEKADLPGAQPVDADDRQLAGMDAVLPPALNAQDGVGACQGARDGVFQLCYRAQRLSIPAVLA